MKSRKTKEKGTNDFFNYFDMGVPCLISFRIRSDDDNLAKQFPFEST